MAALANTMGDTLQGKFYGIDFEVINLDVIALRFQSLDAAKIATATEGGFKGETGLGCAQAVELLEEEACCLNLHRLGVEWRQAEGDEIDIDEVADPSPRQQLPSEGGLAGAIRAGDDEAEGRCKVIHKGSPCSLALAARRKAEVLM